MSAVAGKTSNPRKTIVFTKNKPKQATHLLLFCLLLLSIGSIRLSAQTLPQAKFTDLDTETPIEADKGHVTLHWEAGAKPEAWHYELQQINRKHAPPTRTLYQGPDRLSFISGLPEGTHEYRVRSVSKDGSAKGDWSQTAVVYVEYVDFSLVKKLMVLGGITFVATVLIISGGALRTRKETN